MEIEQIIRTKRKTVSLQVTDKATLVVRAPLKVSNEMIIKIVDKHKKWIDKKKIEINQRNLLFTPKKFIDGEQFLFLGKYYNLRIVDNQHISLKLYEQFTLHKDFVKEARQVFTHWYKRKAYEVISERLSWYCQLNGFMYEKFSITNAQTRWGSCSQRNVNFTWRLVMAPISVIDYVVVHELVHLDEKNHSRKFWGKLKKIMPEYEIQRNWLKNNGYLLKL